MTTKQIKSLTLCTFLLIGINNLYALPERYTVIAQETIRNFFFYEDQPWANPPEKLSIKEKLSTQKVIILHLWATSCPTCLPELFHLEKTATKYMNKPIEFIALSLNDPRSGVLRNFFNRNHFAHLKPYHKASSSRPAIKGLPTTFFFNKQGKLIGRIEGAAKWESPEMHRLLDRLIDEEIPIPQKPKTIFTSYLERIRKCFL